MIKPQETRINRYPIIDIVASSMNPLDDVLNWVSGFTSKKYVREIIQEKHGPRVNPNISERTIAVTQYVHLCCEYIEQAKRGPKELAYLPLYYGILNLAKAYIVVGKYAIELHNRNNRHHGAHYEHGDFSSLDNDNIYIYESGILPLFYKTLLDVSLPIRNNRLQVKMKDIYAYIRMVSAEYGTACGAKKDKLIPFYVTIEEQQSKYSRLKAECISELASTNRIVVPRRLLSIQAFSKMRRIGTDKNTLYSKKYVKDDAQIWSHVRRSLLYDEMADLDREPYVCVPFSEESLLLPEEFPILCAFYHLSNIVRYNPSALDQLMDSKYWPTVLSLQSHGVYSFLLLFYRYMMQTTIYIVPK